MTPSSPRSSPTTSTTATPRPRNSPSLSDRPSRAGALSPPSSAARPGTGKTTTVRRIFREVAGTTRRIVPAYVNCRHDRTPLAVYRSIFKALLGYAPPPTGWHLDDIKEGIATRLHDDDAALIVCLDDANELIAAGTYNTLLYQILRLYEKCDVKKPGVFAVTSDLALNLYAEADESVRSVFHPTEVTFLPYTHVEVREILADRVRQGLYPRVVSKALLDRIARIAAGEQDVRVGIDLVRTAVLRAEKGGRDPGGHRTGPPQPGRGAFGRRAGAAPPHRGAVACRRGYDGRSGL